MHLDAPDASPNAMADTNGRQSPTGPATNGHSMEDSSAPSARLCHIVKWAHFDGYGFNLHAEKGKPGQMIGKVDEGSPAEAAGLREGDRIVEVNGVNIANENHKQVVQRIKAVEDETKLLVVDAEADKYFKAHDIVIKSSLPNVMHLKTPPAPSPAPSPVNGQVGESEVRRPPRPARGLADSPRPSGRVYVAPRVGETTRASRAKGPAGLDTQSQCSLSAQPFP